jgi:hypothetical protein
MGAQGDDLLTEDELLDQIRQVLNERGDQSRLANAIGVSQGALSGALKRHRHVGPHIAAAFGYRRTIRYERDGR